MSRDWKYEFPSRRGLFLTGGGVAFAVLTARLAELQLFRSQEFETKATENRIRLDPAPPHRGTIFDRNGRDLTGGTARAFDENGNEVDETASIEDFGLSGDALRTKWSLLCEG